MEKVPTSPHWSPIAAPVPSSKPTSPLIVDVFPALLISVSAKTAKLFTAPRSGVVSASGAARETSVGPLSATAIARQSDPAKKAKRRVLGLFVNLVLSMFYSPLSSLWISNGTTVDSLREESRVRLSSQSIILSRCLLGVLPWLARFGHTQSPHPAALGRLSRPVLPYCPVGEGAGGRARYRIWHAYKTVLVSVVRRFAGPRRLLLHRAVRLPSDLPQVARAVEDRRSGGLDRSHAPPTRSGRPTLGATRLRMSPGSSFVPPAPTGP